MADEILKVQIQKIHIAKQQLQLSDENYRDILSNFKNAYNWPCKSCKELNQNQANVVLDIFKKQLGWREKKFGKNLKYEEYNTRDQKFASPAQMRLIESTWMNNINVKEKTDRALNNFTYRILKVNHLSFVLKKDVNRLLKAIKSLSLKSEIKNQQSTIVNPENAE
jgi:phage gp16-like protein